MGDVVMTSLYKWGSWGGGVVWCFMTKGVWRRGLHLNCLQKSQVEIRAVTSGIFSARFP